MFTQPDGITTPLVAWYALSDGLTIAMNVSYASLSSSDSDSDVVVTSSSTDAPADWYSQHVIIDLSIVRIVINVALLLWFLLIKSCGVPRRDADSSVRQPPVPRLAWAVTGFLLAVLLFVHIVMLSTMHRVSEDGFNFLYDFSTFLSAGSMWSLQPCPGNTRDRIYALWLLHLTYTIVLIGTSMTGNSNLFYVVRTVAFDLIFVSFLPVAYSMLPCQATSPDTPAAVKAEEETGSSHRILQSSLMRSLYRRRLARYYQAVTQATSLEAPEWRKMLSKHVFPTPREWQDDPPSSSLLHSLGRVIEEVCRGFKWALQCWNHRVLLCVRVCVSGYVLRRPLIALADDDGLLECILDKCGARDVCVYAYLRCVQKRSFTTWHQLHTTCFTTTSRRRLRSTTATSTCGSSRVWRRCRCSAARGCRVWSSSTSSRCWPR